MKIMTQIYTFLSIILALDVTAFFVWILSGQLPVTGVYAGMLTANLLRLFF